MTATATHVAELRGDAGTGPALVYIPGIDGSGELLLGTAARLETRFRVIRLCYRVHGGPPPEGDTYARLAKSIIAVLDEAGVDKAVILAESFGGAVAFRLALDYPERVASLAIVNSFVYYEATFRLSISRFTLRLVPSFVYRLCRYLFAPMLMLAPRKDPVAVAEFRRAPLLDLEGGYLRRMKMISAIDLRDELGRIEQFVELYASTHDRVIDSPRASAEMADLLPNVNLTIIEKAGHVVLPLSAEPWLERLIKLAERSGLI